MQSFVEYTDDRIRVKLPQQLRQKCPMRFFRGNLRRGKPESRVTIAIDLNFDDRRARAIRESFLGTKIENRPMGNHVIRLGPLEFGENGLELLTSSLQPDSGYIFYCWDTFFAMNGQHVMLSMLGGGPQEEFESMARTVIKSFTIIGPQN